MYDRKYTYVCTMRADKMYAYAAVLQTDILRRRASPISVHLQICIYNLISYKSSSHTGVHVIGFGHKAAKSTTNTGKNYDISFHRSKKTKVSVL